MRNRNTNYYSKKPTKGLTVEVKFDNVEQALRKFKKMTVEDGRLDEYKARTTYTKPSIKRREARKLAALRQRRSIETPKKDY